MTPFRQIHLDALPSITKRAFENKEVSGVFGDEVFKSTMKAAKQIVIPLNMTTLIDRASSYTSFNAFFNDVLWIIHNCLILFPGKKPYNIDMSLHHVPDSCASKLCDFSEDSDKLEAARALYDHFVEEVESVKKCVDCHSNALAPIEWFEMPCSKPHLVVWAKMKEMFWPAKVMDVEDQMLSVRYFGDHTHAYVAATNCYLFSIWSPNKTRNLSIAYRNAMQVSSHSTLQRPGVYSWFIPSAGNKCIFQ